MGHEYRVFVIFILFYVRSTSSVHYMQRRLDFHVVPHALDLDTVTFDKVISKFNVSVVMFIDFMTMGTKLIEYKAFAASTVTQPEVVAATVAVEDDVELTNWELAERFNIKRDELPQIWLFVDGKDAEVYTGPVSCNHLREYVTKKTGLWIGRPGMLEYYDRLTVDFIKAHSDVDRKAIIESAKNYKDENITSKDGTTSANYYIKLMEDFITHGPTHPLYEHDRLKSQKALHKSHKDRLCGIEKQISIVQSFQRILAHPPHDEL